IIIALLLPAPRDIGPLGIDLSPTRKTLFIVLNGPRRHSSATILETLPLRLRGLLFFNLAGGLAGAAPGFAFRLQTCVPVPYRRCPRFAERISSRYLRRAGRNHPASGLDAHRAESLVSRTLASPVVPGRLFYRLLRADFPPLCRVLLLRGIQIPL